MVPRQKLEHRLLLTNMRKHFCAVQLVEPGVGTQRGMRSSSLGISRATWMWGWAQLCVSPLQQRLKHVDTEFPASLKQSVAEG